MKILSILNELDNKDVGIIYHALTPIFAKHGMRFVITNHAAFDRLITDKTRQNITRDNVIYTLDRLIQKCTDPTTNYAKKLDNYRKHRQEIEGVVCNLNNNLHVVFAIDYNHPQSSRGMYNFKVITAIVTNDFKTGNYAHTEKFFIR
jgi:hypothetical protein